jgi:hypothetical protein
MNPFTVSNPSNPSETYTFGSRGRKPEFVTTGLKNGSIKIPDGYLTAAEKIAKINSEKPIVKKVIKVPKIVEETETLIDDTGPKFWKWIGVNTEMDDKHIIKNGIARCIVVADNPSEAIRELNKTFKHNLVSQLEFNSCWKKFIPDDVIKEFSIGAYQFTNDMWEKRKTV